jgi:lysozyme family protein
MATNKEMASAYRNAINALLAVKTDFAASAAERAAASAAIDELNHTWIDDAQARYEARTASLNVLIERINAVSARIESDPLDKVRERLNKAAAQARAALHKTAQKAFKDLRDGATSGGPDETVPPPVVTVDETLSSHAAGEDVSAEIAPPPPRPALVPPSPSAVRNKQHSAVPGALYDDYTKLFEASLVRPDRLANVNGHVQRLLELRECYESVGGPLGIPWWFIGAIHGLETGYRFDRHLHNGDPLGQATTHVPQGRPRNWASAGDKTWEASARDALMLKALEQWSDWSAPGALYQWERYNGFGYRKYHPEVLSPYLWSFSNHYTSGKYVADGRFDDNAVSKQCGAASIFRVLVNTAVVIL